MFARYLQKLGLFVFLCGFLVTSRPAVAFELSSEEFSSGFEVFVPNLDPGFEITGSALFLRPSAGNLGWAAVTDFLPFVTPNWHIKQLKPDYQAAFNVGVHYVFPCSGIDTRLDWTHLRTSDSQSVVVTPILQWVSPFSQTGPGTGDTDYDPTGVGELTQAKGKVKFHYDVVNWDVGTHVNFGCNMRMRVFTGLSGVHIRERLISVFRHPSGLPRISLVNTSSFTGIGPRLGFDCAYQFCGGFNFVGQFAGSLLIGSMQPAQYRFSGSSAALAAIGISSNDERISSNSVNHLVPALDAKLGLSYETDFWYCYRFSLEIGYMGAVYLNALSGYETGTNVLPLELGSLSTNSMKHIESDFSVHGPYIQAAVKF